MPLLFDITEVQFSQRNGNRSWGSNWWEVNIYLGQKRGDDLIVVISVTLTSGPVGCDDNPIYAAYLRDILFT